MSCLNCLLSVACLSSTSTSTITLNSNSLIESTCITTWRKGQRNPIRESPWFAIHLPIRGCCNSNRDFYKDVYTIFNRNKYWYGPYAHFGYWTLVGYQIRDTTMGFPYPFRNVVIDYFSPTPLIFHKSPTLKLTWTVIYNCKRQPYFFYRVFI